MILEENRTESETLQGFDLSPQQQRLWLLQQAEPGTVFRSQCAVRIEGFLDRAKLARALARVVAQNEILRTVFRRLPGMSLPLQVVLETSTVSFVHVDLAALAAEDRDCAAARLFASWSHDRFDLEQGSVLRACLVALGEREHLLMLALPALCADPATFENLIAEIASAYDGPLSAEEEPPLQYADLSEWQNRLLESEDGVEQLEGWKSFWRERDLATKLGWLAPLEQDADRATAPPFEPASLTVTSEPALVAELARRLTEWDVEAPVFLLACWQMLLWRSTGQADVLVGVFHDGRRYEELQPALGPLARYLPVECRLEETMRVRAVLALVHETLGEAAKRQERFSWLHLEGEGASTPGFFPVCFQAIEPPREVAVDGLRLAVRWRNGFADRFKLELACSYAPGALEMTLRYDRHRYDRATIELLAERLRMLLASVVAHPDATLRDLELLGAHERRWLAELGAAPASPVLRDEKLPLHRHFELQVERTPERVAVVQEGEGLTFAALNLRANRLAHHLRSLGVGIETPVAICLERSTEAVVALLAVLKAGGAWVPLDPSLPPDRLAWMLEDVGARVVVTRESWRRSLPGPDAHSDLHVLCLDAEAGRIAERPATDPAGGASPENLAYAIYTSGSTGRPKGVQIEHRSAVNLLIALEKAVLEPLGAISLRASLNAPLAFDASVQQLVLLLAGHTLCVIPEEVRTDGAALLAFLRDQAIDLFDCTPSQLRILLAAGLLEEAGAPRVVLAAGEAIDPGMWNELQRSTRTTFYNVYGPTECTVDSTAHRIERHAAGEAGAPRPVIGRPLANYGIRLLDRCSREVPVGAPGELCVSGRGLARGYVNRPDLTAERFVPDPFTAGGGERLYRTGDLARYLSDGRLEFLGRIDHQLKLRGYRIEPGEIESVLAGHPWVRRAVVVVQRDAGGGALLVAYVLPSEEAPAGFVGAPPELHAFLRQRLPVYMVPAEFVGIPVFPMTPNGKVDRQALALRPLPDRQARSAGAPVVPRNPIEEVLAAIWREVLRLDEVSVEDNFFQLGGDSILSIQVISRASQAGLRLSARQLFEHQTIAGLARVAEEISTSRQKAELVLGPVPLTPIQRSFLEQDLPHPEHYNHSLLLEPEPSTGGRLDAAALRLACEALLTHHDALRMRFEPAGDEHPEWRQTNEGLTADLPLAQVDLSALAGTSQSPALEAIAVRLQTSLDLTRGPLLRLVLFHLGENQPDRLLLIIHHLVVDGVSWRIILEDLETVYRQLLRGEEPSLPAKTAAFQSWAERLVEYARTPAAESQAAYWLERASQPVPPVPVDYAGGTNTAGSSRGLTVGLDVEETRRLLQEVPRAYRTQINDVLATALVEAVSSWTGSRKVWVELEGHGREEIFPDLDVSRTVGWFTTVFPVLLDLDGISAPGDALKTVKEQLRAVPERGFGFGVLQFMGKDEIAARLRALPQGGIIFNYLGQFDQAVAEGRLFRGARESTGPGRSDLHTRIHLLEVSGKIAGGRLWVSWTYSEACHHRATVEDLARRFIDALRALIVHCQSPEAGGYTPSDFPLAKIDQSSLDSWVAAAGGTIEDLYPATPMQQGLLFHTLLVPRSGAHIGQLHLLFRGGLDLAAFEAAWSRVIARHTALRTAFVGFDRETPLQRVHSRAEVPLRTLDWRELSEEGRRERVAAYLEEDLRHDFDPARPPLLRLVLIREEEAAYRFVCTHHHAILDGWSLPILLREFLACYRATLQGGEAVLGPVAQYRDYIGWLVQQSAAAAEVYWRRELADFAEPTPIGGEGSLADSSMAPFQILSWKGLPTDLTSALGAWARQHQVTVNTVVQGAWALLLRRLSGRPDVVFGVVSSGRSAPVRGIEEMVGLFINTLPARVKLQGDMPLPAWLQGIQERQAELRQYEHSSLVQVQAWSGVAAGLPLFESILAFENFPVDESVQKATGETLGIADADAFDQTVYPLGLSVTPGSRLSLRLSCDPRRFSEPTMRRILDQLESLFEAMIAHGGRSLETLPLLSAAEWHQVLIEWNDTTRPLARGACLPERIDIWGEELRDTVAVVCGTSQLSYGELGSRARRWGAWLRGLGIRQESVVGLSMGRSPALIETLLGVWQAQALFVVLDSALPLERRRFMVEDAGVELVLTDEASWEDWVCPTFAVEEVALPADPGPGWNGERLPETGAYVIYTSGSTGRPKGVLVPHAGLRDLVENQRELLAVGPGSRVVQWASWSFDASIFDVSMALGAGGTLVLGTAGPLPGPELADLLAREAVSHWTVTPSALAALPTVDLPALVSLTVAGEAFPEGLAERWAGSRRMTNAYGPTEATIWATAHRVAAAGRPPIGRPIGNARAYVMDAAGTPVPPGADGELWLGGPGIARGYLHRPDLTAERFVPSPFGSPGDRLYRTGDRVRFLPDGTLEFLGRIDNQVKVRGFRIELGEIETALATHSRVDGAVVVAQTEATGDQRLVAFVVPRERSAGLVGELRESLEQTLPAYMIPNHFVLLDHLPLNPSGKVDRKELERWEPERDRAARGSAASSEAQPRTLVEELVAGIFTEVLQIERIGVDENFFDVGGHSLMAIQVVSRVQILFGVELPLGVLFDSPTVALFSARIEELKPQSRGPLAPPIVPVPRGRELPLSFAQERLWFLDQLDPGMATYNLPMALHLRGSLIRPLLDATLSYLVGRHEALRTRFEAIGGRALQVIDSPAAIVAPVVDLKGLSAEGREAFARALAAEEAGRPFDLACGPLLRVTLLLLEPERHVVLLTAHHIVADGWSLGILVRELGEIYSALSQGRQPDLPALPVQYADYAVWQRAWLSGEVLESQLDFWREHLAGAPVLLSLPLDRPRPPIQSFRGAREPFLVREELARSLEGLGRKHGATLFMTYLAAFAAMLARLSGQEDCVVGTPVANRNRLETQGLIGFFVNTLALRARPSGDKSFADLLAEIREEALAAYASQDLPFEMLVDELAPERSLAHSPLFQVMFDFQNARDGGLELPGLQLESFPSGSVGEKFDLTLSCVEMPGGMAGRLGYNPDLFDATTAKRMVGYFGTLVAEAAQRTEDRLADLVLLSAAERHQILIDWSDRVEQAGGLQWVHEQFAAQAARTPDAVAIVFEREVLQYGELDRRAQRVARSLRRLGVGPESRVGLCVGRSPRMILGLLGILKSGGAFVPLDPTHPPARLAYMVEDAGVRVVLTEEHLKEVLPEVETLCLDREPGGALSEDEAGELPVQLTKGEDLAYVIYTSGSTGQPKGVMVEHASLASVLAASRQAFGWAADDAMACAAPFAFDIFLFELLNPLLVGGRCRLLPVESGIDVEGWTDLLPELTRIHAVPALMRQLVDAARRRNRDYPQLRSLFVGGDRVPLELLLEMREVFPEAGIHVLYGPTEATIIASSWTIPPGSVPSQTSIGLPLPDVELLLLDARGHAVPIGVAGEIWIGGPGVSRGYLDRPELTAERYPIWQGRRFYRAGDLARWQTDGTLEFLGRVDQQVKIRGFRIELGEIEAALLDQPDVREAVVAVREERTGEPRLVAYVVPAGPELKVGSLRQALGQKLPEYMVPSAFMTLPEMPLTRHGKVDRTALPAPEQVRRDGADGEEPRTEVEHLLVRIWCEVLGLERVGVRENFFELGGDSILSIQVVSRATQAGYRLTPRQLFEHQTIAELAAVAGSAREVDAEQGAVVGRALLTPIQRRFFASEPVDPHHFILPVLLALRKEGLGPDVVRRALAALVEHHDALRMRFAAGPEGWEPWVEAPGGEVPWSRWDLREATPSGIWEALAELGAQVQQSLDLTRGPLVRGVWVDLPQGASRMLLVVHHLVTDGVSWRILLDDLERVCRQLMGGERIELPAKTTSYQQWAERLSNYAATRDWQEELRLWRREALDKGSLPVDGGRQGNVESSVRSASISLDAEETRALLQEAGRAYRMQAQELLLTALGRVLGEVRVDLEGHGRQEDLLEGVDLTRTVGWFTVVYPVRLSVTGMEEGEALRTVKEQLRSVPDGGLGYGLLHDLLGELAEAGPSDVSFNYLGQLDQVLVEDSWFGGAGEPIGPTRSPRALRPHLLDVTAAVAGGRLRVGWSYSENVHRTETVERWASRFVAELRSLIAHCRGVLERREGRYTPADFPMAALGAAELDRVLAGEWGVEDLYPLSPLQEGFLFHSLYQPGSGVYVEQVLSRLTGELDVEALEGAWRRVVQAHPILRTSIRWRDLERPLQVVHGEVVVEVRREDWRDLPPERQETLLESLLAEDRERGFDLTRAPLMRWVLVRTGPSEHWFLWTQHHILLDGWSFSAVVGEFLSGYGALRAGGEPQLPRRRPYRDYIEWLGRQDLAQTEEFWRRNLAGWRGPTVLALAREVDPARHGAGVQWMRCTAAESLELQQLARRRRLTLNTLVQGAWAVLLGRTSGSPDVVFGATVSGRPSGLPGVESILGLFINTLPVRLHAAGASLLLPWLEELQRQQSELRQYEHTPLVKIQEWSEVARGTPLFESLLVVESYPRDASMKQGGGGGFAVSEVRVQEQTNYPLTASAVPGDQLLLSLEYARSHFDTVTVERMLGHFRNLLLGMLALSEAGRLSDLPLLAAAELHQLTASWNDTGRLSEPRLVHELFGEQAAQAPGAVAVVHGDRELSYGELDRQANRLAWHLRGLGVGPDIVVGLCAERSLEMVVGLLGILKAGGAYLPLDPAAPAERLALLLEDAGAPVVLATAGTLDRLPRGAAPVVRLDRVPEGPAQREAEAPQTGAVPGNLAYVMYTSGSTGRPKGVLVEHGSVAWYARTASRLYGLKPTDRVLQFAPVTFDISVEEIFPGFSRGATLVLASEDMLSPVRFLARCEEWQVTAVSVATAYWHELCAEVESRPESFPASLRVVCLGGEKVLPERVRSWQRLVGDRVALFNTYGPTETTVIATLLRLEGDACVDSIGGPIAGARAYVLDRDLSPLPVETGGELYLGGAGVARGYLGRPDLTAERFVPDPWGSEAGGRLYRTGDRARWRGDATLEFLGRFDEQIKVRGFRVEPGEIEAALASHPRIVQAAVVPYGSGSADRRLAAYLAGDGGDRIDPAALRSYLLDRLPDYMVPSAFVWLDRLPLTPHGKIDRRALPSPEERAGSAGVVEGPRNTIEELLCGIWSEVLKLGRVGRRESFFELGGHSLLATQVASRVRATFGVEIPLRALFEGPTIEALALRIEELLGKPAAAAVPAIEPVARPEHLPLSFAQERLWFLEQLNPGTATYNMPMALGLRGDLDLAALRRSLIELMRRHEVLRTRYATVEGRPVQVIDASGDVGLPRVDLQGLSREAREEEAKRLLRQQGGRPFDLSRELPLRAGLLRLEPDRHAVWLTMHHIASDGWSMGILVRELSVLYEAELRGEVSDLPELGVQYADFAVWQRGWLTGDELERQLHFWRQSLAGAPPLLELPLDRPRPVVQSFRGARVPLELPRDLADELAVLSRSHGATTFMVLLAGLSALLSRVTAQEDLVVGTVVANRNRREIEDLIGFFVNTLALRMKVPGEMPLSELIREAREAALGSYAHQDLPFEKLVEELAPQRSRAHSPLFQVLFVLQNAPEAALELPGLALEPLSAAPEGAARFDLTLAATEGTGGIFGAWEYNRDLFDATTIARLSDHFATLLRGAMKQPGRRLSDLPLLSAGQHHQVLVEWDDVAVMDRPASGVLDQIEHHARHTPEAIAATFSGERLTYGELDARADRLARWLREQGVGPEICVGLCLERSFDLLVGMLAILKAGGAYLPLDPSYPIDRLAFMLEDAFAGSALRLVLVEEGPVHDALAARVPGLRRIGVGDFPAQRGTAAPQRAAPEDLAYVIYTSGTTGRPKGVAVTHRGLANLAAAQRRLFEVEPSSKVLQFSSPSFDASVSEVVVTLTAGACLCLADRQAMMPGPDLARLLDDSGITVVTLPPSALAALPEEPYPALRTLVVAGENCPPDLAWRWARTRRVVNAYGPTEMTVCASADLVREDEALSIGRPIDGTRLHVLDSRMKPVPIGVAGELYLTGPGLARGYHGRPEMTAEAFVPNPFTVRTGERLYRTGDRVRRLPDGRLEFLGRVDRQVKVRGFRIEPGEIEAALARHPAVSEAAALVREERPGDRRLVAYVVPREGDPLPAELRAFLRDLLPEYMVPSRFVVLERLPVLPNGKVDLQSLARERGAEETSKGVAPRNPWEAALAEIFAEVLGLESVGVEDDFFDLGGHSLLAVGLVARIEKRFGRKLPLATLFEGPTVEQVALRLFEPSRFAAWSPLVAMHPEGLKPPFFCVHPVGGGVTGYYRHLMRHLGPDQPFYGLQARGLEEQVGLRHPSIEEMASEYVGALRSVQPHGPYLLGGASYGGWVAFEMAQQLTREGEQIALLALFDAAAPKRLETNGPEEEEALPDPAIQSYGMAHAMAVIAGKELRLSFEELRDLPLEEMLALVLERAREAGLADETIDVPWLVRYQKSFNERLRSGAQYRAQPYEGRIDLFRPTGAPEAEAAEPVAEEDPTLGWNAVASAGVAVHRFSGTHANMFLEPYVIDLAGSLTACIDRVERERED
ncbi:MAG TPA: non-ribosomal peptide synthase/polyketide synthase [Thermoanaerobaculia bacterium]|nr:non-ribosomal peptide synthase/polyketide synthase [Thermoanaerobaculia bacterium]